ncbi:hypothetical protein [Proteus phage VTCCBPA139]|nr:hypothetical protein [Proteus phage 1]QNN97885.1 hypothetical protein [Proteus phage 2]QOC54993.1 hypothetical protein [Proteus phage M4H10_20]QVQ56932.1 hypothetical protein [Proteus phage VTCCBPA139]
MYNKEEDQTIANLIEMRIRQQVQNAIKVSEPERIGGKLVVTISVDAKLASKVYEALNDLVGKLEYIEIDSSSDTTLFKVRPVINKFI